MEKIDKAIRYYRKLEMTSEEMIKFRVIVDYDTKWGCPPTPTKQKTKSHGYKKAMNAAKQLKEYSP